MFFRTRATFGNVFKIDGSLCFKVQSGQWFRIVSLNKGVAVLDTLTAISIEEFVEIVVGCFDEKSNMFGFQSIEFEYNGFKAVVKASDADVQKLLSEYYSFIESKK